MAVRAILPSFVTGFITNENDNDKRTDRQEIGDDSDLLG
jgi:hypothetical protein